MEEHSTLAEHLAVLAEEKRSRLGEPPSAELLVALRNGKLSELEAERVRDWLAVDPGLAAIYLDLGRISELEADVSADEVDRAWATLSAKIDAETPPARVLPFHRRRTGRAILALAAVVIVALGVAWLVGRGGPALPEGKYVQVELTGTLLRGGEIAVPRDAVGIAFEIETAGLPDEVVVEMVDASSQTIRSETLYARPESTTFAFRVAASSLTSGKTYRIAIRSPQASPSEPPLREEIVTVVLENRG